MTMLECSLNDTFPLGWVESNAEGMLICFETYAVLIWSKQNKSIFSSIAIVSIWSFKIQFIYSLFFSLVLFYLGGIHILIIITMIIITIHIIIILKTLNKLLLIPHDEELGHIHWLYSALNFPTTNACSSSKWVWLRELKDLLHCLILFRCNNNNNKNNNNNNNNNNNSNNNNNNQLSFWQTIIWGKMYYNFKAVSAKVSVCLPSST